MHLFSCKIWHNFFHICNLPVDFAEFIVHSVVFLAFCTVINSLLHLCQIVCCGNPQRILFGHFVFSWFKTCFLLHMYRHSWWCGRFRPQSLVLCNSRKFGTRVFELSLGWGFLLLFFILLGGLVLGVLDVVVLIGVVGYPRWVIFFLFFFILLDCLV